MLSIDEAIAHAREEAKEIRENIIDGNNLEPYESYCNAMTGRCAEEHEQIAEWLEELKSSRQELNELRKYSYVQGLSDGYINAIDDFAKLVEIWCWKHEQYNQDDLNKLMNIAEQLKAGGENERSI